MLTYIQVWYRHNPFLPLLGPLPCSGGGASCAIDPVIYADWNICSVQCYPSRIGHWGGARLKLASWSSRLGVGRRVNNSAP